MITLIMSSLLMELKFVLMKRYHLIFQITGIFADYQLLQLKK